MRCATCARGLPAKSKCTPARLTGSAPSLCIIDATMRLFYPATDPDDIPALRRYPRRTEWFARGEVTQRIYEAFRDAELIWPREIARAAMAAKDVPDTEKMVVRDITGRFTNVCYDLTRRGQLVKVGHGPGAR
jgi:hypothetical protein